MSAPVRGYWADRYALRVEQERVLVDVVLDTGLDWPVSASAQLWDATRDPGLLLRGIPAIGPNAPGVIRGTMPGDGLI